LLVSQKEDDSCSGASSITLEIKLIIQREKKKRAEEQEFSSIRQVSWVKPVSVPIYVRSQMCPGWGLHQSCSTGCLFCLTKRADAWKSPGASPTLAYPELLQVKLSFSLQSGKPVSLGY